MGLFLGSYSFSLIQESNFHQYHSVLISLKVRWESSQLFFFFSKMFGYSSCTFPCKFCKQFVEFYKFIISLFNFTKLPTGILTSCWIYRLIWEEWHLNDIEYSNPWTWLSLFLRSLIFLINVFYISHTDLEHIFVTFNVLWCCYKLF